MSKYGSPFAETEALLAVLSDDEDGLLTVLDSMSDHERRELAMNADRLSSAIRRCVLPTADEYVARMAARPLG